MNNKKTESRNQSVLNKIDKTSIFFLDNQGQETFYNTSAFKMFVRQSPNKINIKESSNKIKFLLPNLASKEQQQQSKNSLSILRNKNSIGLKKLIKNVQNQQNERKHSTPIQTPNIKSPKRENAKRMHSLGIQKQHIFKLFSTNKANFTQISQLCQTLQISSKRVNREDKEKANTSQLTRKLKQKDNLLRRYKIPKRFNLIKKNRSEMGMSPWPTKYDQPFIGDGYDI